MVYGVFQQNAPWIQTVVAWGQSVQAPFFILDTGFTGDLQVTPQIAQDLRLPTIGVTNVRIANGQLVSVPVALALVLMEGIVNRVEVLISMGSPLAGISFLTKFGYKAIVDCKHRVVTLERA